MTDRHLLDELFAAQYNFDEAALRKAVANSVRPDALVHLAHPFETLSGPEQFLRDALLPLKAAMPDMERRNNIVMRGVANSGEEWIGCCGAFLGTFRQSWMGIPPSGRLASMRFHEFYRLKEGQVVELQAIWDIPELMLQAGVWPMAPALGREWMVPAPATQDGLSTDPRDDDRSASSLALVDNMLVGLGKHAEGGVAAMELEKSWHQNFNWYGPSGIASSRGISGFRASHQIPFLNGLPDRDGSPGNGHLFADNDYIGFTGWPGMHMTVSGGGWMGIAPAKQKITMRSLDFWRAEKGLLRENWVLIDLLHVYHQLGVDVLARMKELATPH